MVGRRQRREMRLQLGEALTTGGAIVLVVTPIVYKAHAASKHVRLTRSLFWPTAWMIVPLVVMLAGVFLILATSTLFMPRRKASDRVIDLAAAERAAPDVDAGADAEPDREIRTGSRSPE